MSIVSIYTYYIVDQADPRTSQWPLTSPLAAILIISIYLYIVLKAGPNFMKNRKPYSLKRIIQVYNVFQVVSCCLLLHKIIVNEPHTSLHTSAFGCHLVDYSDNAISLRLAEAVWWTMMLKISELIETVFFVLRKKHNQVSKLHLYHHTSTFIVGWLLTKYIAGGMTTFPVMLNTCIHILMYTYYFLSTLGPAWQKSLANLKPKLTILQMLQFTVLIFHATIILRDDCEFPKLAAYMFIPNVLVIFYMFYDFYKTRYSVSSQKVN